VATQILDAGVAEPGSSSNEIGHLIWRSRLQLHFQLRASGLAAVLAQLVPIPAFHQSDLRDFLFIGVSVGR
jgi:hypothetical protein